MVVTSDALNSLPTSLTTLSSLASFRRQLKTELFVRSFSDLDSSVIRPHLTVNLFAISRRNRVLPLILTFVRCPCSLFTLRHLNRFF